MWHIVFSKKNEHSNISVHKFSFRATQLSIMWSLLPFLLNLGGIMGLFQCIGCAGRNDAEWLPRLGQKRPHRYSESFLLPLLPPWQNPYTTFWESPGHCEVAYSSSCQQAPEMGYLTASLNDQTWEWMSLQMGFQLLTSAPPQSWANARLRGNIKLVIILRHYFGVIVHIN